MFSKLGHNFSAIFDKIRTNGHITEEEVNKTMREIRVALLEADVSLSVVKDFIEQVKDKTFGIELSKNIMPGQTIIKIVHDELVKILSTEKDDANKKIESKKSTTVVMFIGLQGTGKTTTAAKLALWLKKKKHKTNILLSSTDIYRPAAQLQLEKLANQIGVQSLPIRNGETVEEICARTIETAKREGCDMVIMDTAGRLQTNNELIKELQLIKKMISPDEIILTSDAMIGQESANIAQEFHKQLGITSIILTRIDGDSRGGAALSMKMVTGCPIKFVGTGEKVDALELFHPDRIASQILGMGDVVSLVEKAKDAISNEEAELMAKKIQQGSFDMNDLLKQMRNIKKIGNITSILGMIPGLGKIKGMINNSNMMNDNLIINAETIILSMTIKERENPTIINSSRKKRISKGSGKSIEEINKLLKQFNNIKLMMKQMNKGSLFDKNSKNNRNLKYLMNMIK